mgnify:CR=1 FL=1
MQRPIRSFWMVLSANRLFTVKHLLEEKLQTSCLQLTDLMENQIIFLVFAGDAMQDSRQDLKLGSMYKCLVEFKAGNM